MGALAGGIGGSIGGGIGGGIRRQIDARVHHFWMGALAGGIGGGSYRRRRVMVRVCKTMYSCLSCVQTYVLSPFVCPPTLQPRPPATLPAAPPAALPPRPLRAPATSPPRPRRVPTALLPRSRRAPAALASRAASERSCGCVAGASHFQGLLEAAIRCDPRSNAALQTQMRC